MHEVISQVISFLLLIVIVWFNYTIANIAVTLYKCKKADTSLHFCFNTAGKIVYSVLLILYIVGFVGGIVAIVYGLTHDSMNIYNAGLNVAALISVIFGYFLSSIVLAGKKYMLVGRMMIDYRKLKKVNFTTSNKMSFVYVQNDYSFSTRFVDKTQLRKIIAR